MSEAEAARRFIQLRRRDAEVEENPGETPCPEPRLRDGGELFESGVLDAKSRVAREPLASVNDAADDDSNVIQNRAFEDARRVGRHGGQILARTTVRLKPDPR